MLNDVSSYSAVVTVFSTHWLRFLYDLEPVNELTSFFIQTGDQDSWGVRWEVISGAWLSGDLTHLRYGVTH